jgi:hypothetical protein
MWTYSPSQNQSWCTPRECSPEQSKNEIERDDAAAVGGDLHRHAFAHAAEAVEQVVGQQLEIPGDSAVGAGLAGLPAHGGLLDGRRFLRGLCFQNLLLGNRLL